MPQLEQAPRLTLIAKHGEVRRDLRVSEEASARAQSLLGLTGPGLLGIVTDGTAVVLPYWDRLHTYHLFFRPDRERFYVAAAACTDESCDNGHPHIRALLTLAEYEIDGGEASTIFLRTAASRALGDPVAYREWDRNTFGEKARRNPIRVITYFRIAEGQLDYVVFRNPPLCQDYIDEYGLENAFGHVHFAQWYRRHADKHNLDVEQVVSLQIAEVDKVTLRVDAPERACPDCVRVRRRHEEQATLESQGVYLPVSGGVFARIKRFLQRRRLCATGAAGLAR
ncbi:hypothetical protein [Burkholderia sp. Ac-20365]|uniref:hypothetical protein n=1 Tax=Burkholderia sp. Ac-20365 TaxID=2703897 RepID=UPI00197BBE73|nr:hypothetical protein [Burkholderia sp. Ac-20365]MBN3760929.1 hypothetical protein [Burkholderia sp. Ac-20365]